MLWIFGAIQRATIAVAAYKETWPKESHRRITDLAIIDDDEGYIYPNLYPQPIEEQAGTMDASKLLMAAHTS